MSARRKRRIFPRAIAGILIAAMLATGLVYGQTNVTLPTEGRENRGALVAAEQLMVGGSYVSSSRLSRMG